MPTPGRGKRISAEDRDMTVARSNIPPIEALYVEVRRLQKCREKNKTRVCDAFNDLRDARHRIGQVLRSFETGHQIELAIGAAAVFRHHWIIGHCHRKSVGAKHAAEHIVASAVVEHAGLCLALPP